MNDEIRHSGYVLHGKVFVIRVPSCLNCARILDSPWIPDYFEGICMGCERRLSGFVEVE